RDRRRAARERGTLADGGALPGRARRPAGGRRRRRPAMRVALLDYGAGNLHSLAKGIERGGATVTVTSDWDEALAADALVLPGVGAFSAAVAALPDDPERVRDALARGLPCLGVCLGMQLLFDGSDEGEGAGIGLIPGRVRRLDAP